jgi:membrane-associated protease RseP (regulator of RpoE activity)
MKKLIGSITIIAFICAASFAQTSETFGGFGISVHLGKKGVSVASVLPNSPAAQAGLQAGDVIISVNGTLLSSVEQEKQISLLRGNSGTTAALLVSRGGESINILAKRASISVQELESQDVSAWFGKNKNIALEDLNYLASLKIGEDYELLGVMQKGLLIDSDMEYLNPQPMHQISLKKAAVNEDNLISSINAPNVPKASTLNFANRSIISFSIANETNFSRITVLNVKGATVWQKNLGNLHTGINNINWGGENLPAGSYHVRLEIGSMILAYKFELR